MGLPTDAWRFLDDDRIVVASMQIWIEDFTSGKNLQRMMGHEELVTELVLAPDGLLASGDAGGFVRIWDLTTGTEVAELEGPEGEICSLAIDSAGRWLAACNGRDPVALWDLRAIHR